jgi:hypothetical protein
VPWKYSILPFGNISLSKIKSLDIDKKIFWKRTKSVQKRETTCLWIRFLRFSERELRIKGSESTKKAKRKGIGNPIYLLLVS